MSRPVGRRRSTPRSRAGAEVAELEAARATRRGRAQLLAVGALAAGPRGMGDRAAEYPSRIERLAAVHAGVHPRRRAPAVATQIPMPARHARSRWSGERGEAVDQIAFDGAPEPPTRATLRAKWSSRRPGMSPSESAEGCEVLEVAAGHVHGPLQPAVVRGRRPLLRLARRARRGTAGDHRSASGSAPRRRPARPERASHVAALGASRGDDVDAEELELGLRDASEEPAVDATRGPRRRGGQDVLDGADLSAPEDLRFRASRQRLVRRRPRQRGAEVLDSLDHALRDRRTSAPPGSIGRLQARSPAPRFMRDPRQDWARVDRRILADVVYLIRRYKVRIVAGYGPRPRPLRRASLGLATDIEPGPAAWPNVTRLAKWADRARTGRARRSAGWATTATESTAASLWKPRRGYAPTCTSPGSTRGRGAAVAWRGPVADTTWTATGRPLDVRTAGWSRALAPWSGSNRH